MSLSGTALWAFVKSQKISNKNNSLIKNTNRKQCNKNVIDGWSWCWLILLCSIFSCASCFCETDEKLLIRIASRFKAPSRAPGSASSHRTSSWFWCGSIHQASEKFMSLCITTRRFINMDQSSGNLTSISIKSYRGAMRHSLTVTSWAGLEKTSFFLKVFKVFKSFFSFLDFSVQIRLDTKLRPRKNVLHTILSVTSFSINYNETRKSWIKYEIKHDRYKIAHKSKNI